jgi:SAM-dependent methyltransferase
MGLYTKITRDWLEQRFARRSPAGVYFAHMPVYGPGHPDAEGGHLRRYARILRILQALDGIAGQSLLDVGGAEGFVAQVAGSIFGIEAAAVDLSMEACLRARELFGLPSAAVDCWRLPFADGAFDFVLCSEVIEHVENPVETLLELQRVARVAVILTTEEVHYDRAHIEAYLWKRPGWPHMERNLFHPDDLQSCLPNAILRPQCDREPAASTLPRDEMVAWLLANTLTTELQPGRIGVAATIPGPAYVARQRRFTDAELATRMLAVTVVPGAVARPPSPMVEERWLARMRDPVTQKPLQRSPAAMLGSRRYPVRNGVVDFVDAEAPSSPRAALADRVAALPQREALLSLRDRLFLFERVESNALDLTQPAARRGFWPNEQLQPRGEGFSWHATGDDPWLVTPCLQRRLRTLEIDLRVYASTLPVNALTGQVYWKGPADEVFVEPNSAKFELRNDGGRHTYHIDLAACPNLPEEVQWLRLDLANAPCEIDLYALRFDPD